jgi:hypothetical protein
MQETRVYKNTKTHNGLQKCIVLLATIIVEFTSNCDKLHKMPIWILLVTT